MSALYFSYNCHKVSFKSNISVQKYNMRDGTKLFCPEDVSVFVHVNQIIDPMNHKNA